jgi:hypothetical protein
VVKGDYFSVEEDEACLVLRLHKDHVYLRHE